MLTRKQAELLRFIHERLKEAAVPPSSDEMKDALDLRSKSGIYRLITALEERGFIRRLPNRARAIEVIKLPESVAHGMAASRTRGFTPSVIEGNLGRVRAPSEDDSGRPVAVPVMGRIAAGTPIEAIQTRSHVINMPPDLLTAGEHFALEVRGDLMIDAGILDGDIAVLKRSEAADTGDIVVALIDDDDSATLEAFSPDAVRPSRSNRPIPPMRFASCRLTACAFRASSSACFGGLRTPPAPTDHRPAGLRASAWHRAAENVLWAPSFASLSLLVFRPGTRGAAAPTVGQNFPAAPTSITKPSPPSRRTASAPRARRRSLPMTNAPQSGRRRGVHTHHDGHVAAIFLERFGCERVGDQPSVGQLANAAGRIAGNPLPQSRIFHLAAVGIGGKPIVHGKGVTAGAMEGKFAAFATHGEGTPVCRHQNVLRQGCAQRQHNG